MANTQIQAPSYESGNAKLIDPGIRKVWNDIYQQLEPKLGLVAKVDTLNAAYENQTSYAGLGDVPNVGEGETYSEDAIMHTYDTTFTAAKYGTLMPVSYELFDDQFFQIAGKTESLARATARKVEKLAASMYNNGFNTSYTSFGDAKPLFSTIHPRGDGGAAQSNASTTSIVLSDPNLETMILLMRNALDDRGNLIDLVPDTLVLQPAQEAAGIRITKSLNRSGTADNDANVHNMSEYTGGMLKVVAWNYIGATASGTDTQWFLIDSALNPVTWKWREKPQIIKLPDAVGAKNDVWYWKAKFRSAYGWHDWRGVVGSKGDGTSYTS